MKKIKITSEQYKKLLTLSESEDVRGGINRVNNSFKKAFKKSDVENLSEEPFDIQKPIQGVPDSKMKPKKEPEPITEDVFSPEAQKAVQEFLQNIWMNPSQRGLSTFFVKNGLTWGDIISYLLSVGVITGVGANIYKVNNYFKRIFSKNKNEAEKQKMADIEKITKMIAKDPKAPWSSNSFKDPQGQVLMNKDIEEDNYPMGAKDDSAAPYNEKKPQSQPERPVGQHTFTIAAMGRELLILRGPDGLYLMDNDKLPDVGMDMTPEAMELFINDNLHRLTTGDGMEGFEQGMDLVKLDDKLTKEMLALYAKEPKIVAALSSLQETTSAASSGAFVAPLTTSTTKPEHSPAQELKEGVLIREFNFRNAHAMHTKYDKNYKGQFDVDKLPKTETSGDTIDEMTSTVGGDGSAGSSTTGAYVQPKIWAKNKANHAPSKKTQYPKGEMVDGTTPTGNVAKTHRTKQSVISKNVYEAIAKKTGRTVEDVKNIIETKFKNKPLS